MAQNITIEQQTVVSPAMKNLLTASDAAMFKLYPQDCCYLVNEDELLSSRFEFYILTHNTEAAGCVGLRIDDPHFVEIKRLFVHQHQRGNGFARMLMNHALDRARKRRNHRACLEIGTEQPEALALYQQLGFVDIPAFPPYQPHPLSRFLSLQLGPPA